MTDGPSIAECRFCGNRHGVRYYCDATEHALFAAESELADLRAEKERLERENARLREFVEHVASQRTIMVGNGYSSMARKALGEADR